ncbi:hypothetical protein [Cellvibrio sp. QJXJ]|uniref:hypothetical protein n=1 Tax=Cellvibrio sp. QJXJ TaxID=2964606 RepID=UPI0021C3BE82|nr:hypothetical protein [Cellvibrio sp. QJXJ]UUA73111.1 hypothetical protein NNX04_01360 [Cellvibrio sp. QJXJ]
MKLHKTLTINGAQVHLNTEDLRLDLFNPGRAVFDVEPNAEIKGLVVFSSGYDPQQLQQVFFGYVENTFQIDKKQHRVFCRELCASLSRLVPVSLRNATINEILRAISTETGLQFVTPDKPYSQKTTPVYFSVGSGYACLDSLAEVFEIPQFIWQQQGDGKVFVGGWLDSFWGGKNINLPVDMQSNTGLANSARIACMPKLRPGVFINGNSYITKVHWDGQHQNIEWDKNPWGTRWTNRSSV